MHDNDILYYSQYIGMCLEPSDLSTFWEISGNISETVQDGYIVAIKD